MPVLHKYKDMEGHYILTSIKGSVVTFQVTNEGANQLHSSGVLENTRFPRALLLDLYRSGDAYTRTTDNEKSAEEIEFDLRQLELDFSHDPESENLFPSCSSCSSVQDLHFVEVKKGEPSASILCDSCRLKGKEDIDTSIPLPLVTRGILKRILAMKGIREIDRSVSIYGGLLDADFKKQWEETFQLKPIQKRLFEDEAKNPELFGNI